MTDMIDDSLNSSGLSKGNVLVDCALELGAKWVEQVSRGGQGYSTYCVLIMRGPTKCKQVLYFLGS